MGQPNRVDANIKRRSTKQEGSPCFFPAITISFIEISHFYPSILQPSLYGLHKRKVLRGKGVKLHLSYLDKHLSLAESAKRNRWVHNLVLDSSKLSISINLVQLL